jgi:hypothetical protein
MARRWDIEQGGLPVDERPCNLPPKDPRYQVFGQRVNAVGLIDVLYDSEKFPGERHINLGNLQRMMLYHLQRELVEEVSQIKAAGSVDPAQAARIISALSSYGT